MAMNKEQTILHLKRLIGRVSYFNAAEVGNWNRETESRNEANRALTSHVLEAYESGTLSIYEILKVFDETHGLVNVSNVFPYDFSIVTYRLVEDDGKGGYRTLFHGLKGDRSLPLDKTLRAECKYRRDGSGNKWYTTGFHSIEKPSQLYKYLKFFKKRRNKLRIGIVEVTGLFGKPNSREGVILSKTQKLLSVSEIDWSRVDDK